MAGHAFRLPGHRRVPHHAARCAKLRQRELATFCYIATQGGCGAQTKAHAAANLSAGNTKELLVTVMSGNLPFIGYPRTLNALAAIEDASK
ncbi:carboxymuconolactone decarboxylase family protein [uncultured Senegalimassilia sp.]|uniref:carboxymuconolactone decarboxylase family protein n=1 Tax=uncultured Senegalimassilia sp. TaxID=1714350 RepID=UPI0026753C8C|nr:carboxymuconolactone decarboxylase family protein [uncultured Senegalimassilia sp.]